MLVVALSCRIVPALIAVEIPNSASWSRDEKRLIMRSDGTAQLEFKSDGLVQYRSCTPIETPVLTCTSGNIGLFRAEVEYEERLHAPYILMRVPETP